MDVTVAICTWNRAALLDQTLAGLAAVRVPPGLSWEVVVVNNNSTDDTEAVLARHAGRLPLRPVREAKQGHSHARNRALDEARGDWVLWTDDDVRIDPGWLEGFAGTAARHPDAAAVGGVIEPWFPAAPDPALCAAFPALRAGFCGVDHGPAERELPAGEHVFGANMGFHRGRTAGLRFETALGRVGGTGLLSGDDVEFQNRVRARGGRVVWSPGMRVAHYVEPARMTLPYLCGYYEGLGRSGVRTDGPPAGPTLLGAPRWVVRALVVHRLLAAAHRLTGRRAERYGHLRRYHQYRGVAAACRNREYPA